LPCISSLLKQIDLTDVEAIIVDGYVYLDDDKKSGLGAHLYNDLQEKVPVIGIAKSNFNTLNKVKIPVFRDSSNNPLFVTSIGIETSDAANKIRLMEGPFRIPTLLKALDILTKT
jgi:deoxyribonuclease V